MANEENKVQELYEASPYPDLGAALKDPRNSLRPIVSRLDRNEADGLNYLEAGCGTGHLLIGTAKHKPHWNCAGIDLSSASLAVAEQLAKKNGCSVELHQGSYLKKLPFQEKYFDIISAQGTIHHCDDPVGALRNLSKYLKEDGIIKMHVYGTRLDSKKFDLKECISIFQPDLFAHDERFQIYQSLVNNKTAQDHLRSVLDTSLLDIFRWVRNRLRNARRRSQNISWSPPWTDTYDSPTSPWKDHFCHPCERAYEVPDIKSLVLGANLKVVQMVAQSSINEKLIPLNLQKRFQKLDQWDQWRLMELLGPDRSFSLLLTKA